jgi:hypothetical protein
MMNHTDGWMGGWTVGGIWVWTLVVAMVVLLFVVIIKKMSKK